MRLSRKTEYVLIGLLVIFNIILRLPVTPHEIGADSFVTHRWASSISANGYAKWILHPLSFFGLYPFSYASGPPFFLSGTSQCTGVGMEHTILVITTFLGFFGVFTVYLLAKEIRNDFLFAFSVAFIYSTFRYFISVTTWQTDPFNFFLVFLPLFIWSLLRCHNQKKSRLKYYLLTLGLVIILATIHNIVLFTPLILIAFGVSTAFCLIGEKKNIKINPKVTALIFFSLFIPLFLLPFTPWSLYNPDLPSLQGSGPLAYFFHGYGPHIILLNLGAEYAMGISILIVLAPIGLISLLFLKKKRFSDVFLLALVLCFAPFLMDLNYIRVSVLYIFALLIGLGLMEMLKMLGKIKKVKSVAPLIIIAILAFSALLPYFVVVRHTPYLPMHTGHMNELTYNAALFIKAYGVEIPRISDGGIISARINAIAGPPYYHRDIDKLSSRIEPMSILEFVRGRGKYDYLYKVKVERRWYERFHWTWDCDSELTKRVLNYKTHLVIADNYLPKLAFHRSLHETRPKIYDNGLESIYYLNYNSNTNTSVMV